MEELRKLEEAQVVLELLRSRGVVTASSDPGSDRFLANVVLLLVQPCGELDLDAKCSLISENMPKISSALLEEALVLLGEKDCAEREKAGPSCSGDQTSLAGSAPIISFHDNVDQDLLQSESESEPVIGLDAMQRANSTLEDFILLYVSWTGCKWATISVQIFTYAFLRGKLHISAMQLDTLNEKIVKKSLDGKIICKFKSDPFRPLLLLLECHGLLTERIKEELRSGEEYWKLERKLCCALTSRQEISAEDVMRAIHLKSFDYRVLNLLLYQLRGEEVDDLHVDFLSTSEFLVEVSDDLFDYEDDVLENSFNILRMFVRIYGASAAPAMLAKCITDAEETYNHLLNALEPQLSLQYQTRCEAATAEGGKMGGHPLGTWSMPPVIADEELYRSGV